MSDRKLLDSTTCGIPFVTRFRAGREKLLRMAPWAPGRVRIQLQFFFDSIPSGRAPPRGGAGRLPGVAWTAGMKTTGYDAGFYDQ